jgi:hypothetical protein
MNYHSFDGLFFRNYMYLTPGLIAGEHLHLNDDLFSIDPPDDPGGLDDW